MRLTLPKPTLFRSPARRLAARQRYAAPKSRLLAFLIDNVLFCTFFTAVFYSFYYQETFDLHQAYANTKFGALKAGVAFLQERPYLLGVIFASHWLYHALMESSCWQATLGKRALFVRVISTSGKRLTFLQASARHLTKLFSLIPMAAGFWISFFSRKNQMLHDQLTDCMHLMR